MKAIPSQLALCVAAAAGAATLVVELAAVRLVAPWFGASIAVWTNVIGVVLLALSLGYLLGARLAARPRPERALAVFLALAAAATGWLPAAARPVCEAFVPEGLGLAEVADLVTWGSLAATLVLFLPPALLLGATQPLCVELVAAARGGHAGRAGGQVLAASTLASLAGTFATTHALLPGLGITRTLLGTALLLALVAAGLWPWARRPAAPVALGLALLAPALFASRLRLPDLPAGVRELERRESAYQLLRVVEDARAEPAVRLLQVNEGRDSFQSVWTPRTGLIGEGYYYDYFALPAWWARAHGPWRAAVLGLGAGTAWRVLEGASPPGVALDAWGVELDPAVVEAGERWFELEPGRAGRAVASGEDARTALARRPGPFDLVILDAYAHQVEIPPHLATIEFFREVRAKLAPGGWLAVNVGAFGCDDPLVEALAATIASAFEQPVLALRVPAARNVVLYARRDAEPPRVETPEFRVEGEVGAALLAAAGLPGHARELTSASGPILTDDKNPIDELQRRSLEEGRARLFALP